MRYQLVFVLRDTAVDFINVVCWGQEEFINNTSQLLKVGDIGKVCDNFHHRILLKCSEM